MSVSNVINVVDLVALILKTKMRLDMALVLTLSLVSSVNAFYVPGVAPTDFKKGDPIEVGTGLTHFGQKFLTFVFGSGGMLSIVF